MLFWIYLADMPIFNVLSSAGSRIALVSQIQSGREEKGRERARERERGFKILSVRNAKFMNTPLTTQLDLCEIIIHYLMLKHS